MPIETLVPRRDLLKGAAIAVLFIGAAPSLAPLCAEAAEADIVAKPLFWTDGPLHSMFTLGHWDETRFLAAARRDADEYLHDHTEEGRFTDWGNEKDVLGEWSEADVLHQHRRWVVREHAPASRKVRIVRVLPAGADGYPVGPDGEPYGGEDASLVACDATDEGAFAVTIIHSGLQA